MRSNEAPARSFRVGDTGIRLHSSNPDSRAEAARVAVWLQQEAADAARINRRPNKPRYIGQQRKVANLYAAARIVAKAAR